MNLFEGNRKKKEQEREVEFRQGLNRIRIYLAECRQHQKRYWDLARRARSLDDQPQCELISRRYLWTTTQIKAWEKYLLQLETLSLTREQVRASTAFGQSLSSLSASMLSGASPSELSRMQHDLEQAIARGASLDETLSVALEASSRSLLNNPFLAQTVAWESEFARLEGPAEQEQSDLQEIYRRLDEELHPK